MKALLVVCALAGIAHAKPEKVEVTAAKQLLATQLAAINAGDAAAFAATFDPGAYVIFPRATEAATPADVKAGTAIWFADLAGKVTTAHVTYGDTFQSDVAWIALELIPASAPKTRLRMTELVAIEQDSGFDHSTPAKAAMYRILAAHISEAMDDKTALALAAAGGLAALPSVIGGDPGNIYRSDNPQLLWRSPATDAGATVVGSAPAEFVTGAAAAVAKLRSWKSLNITLGTFKTYGDNFSANAAGGYIGHVTIAFKVGGKVVNVPFRLMTAIDGPPPATGPGDYDVGFVHYSIAKPDPQR